MQLFHLALGAALFAAVLAAPVTKQALQESDDVEFSIDTLTDEMLDTDWVAEKRYRRNGKDENSNDVNDYMERSEVPCAILIDGYKAPLCDVRPSAFTATEVHELPFTANDGTPASWQYIKIENAILQKGKGAFSSQADCDGEDTYGNSFPTAEEWASKNNVLNTKYPAKLMCAVVTGHHKSRISGAHSCAELCDMVPDCHSFSTKAPHCTLYNIKEEDVASTERQSDVFWKATTKQYKGTMQDRTYFKTTDKCEATAQVNYPCYPEDGFIWGDVAKIDVAAMASVLTWGADATPWLGTAPAQFMNSNVGDNTIQAKYEPGATFSAADPDCGCEYGTWTSGIKSGDEVGYGVYETKLKSTASEFTNAFWFQGDSTEINVLKVNDAGKAVVSYHCFNDEGSTVSDQGAEFDVDLSKDVTATLIFTADNIVVSVNNVIVYDVATPSCMQGATMKPIFSIETGDQLPSDSNAADGTMTITYFKSWAGARQPTDGSDFTCPSVYSSKYSGLDSSTKCFADAANKWGYRAEPLREANQREDGRKCNMMGPYQGLSAGLNYEKGLCGLKPLRLATHKMWIESTNNFRIYGSPKVGGDKCDSMPGCVAVSYNTEEKFSMLFTSGTSRTDEATEYILFLRKTANTERTCTDEIASSEWKKVCHERLQSGSKYNRCPIPASEAFGGAMGRNQVFYDPSTQMPNIKTDFQDKTSQGITSKSVGAVTLDECRQITELAHAAMMVHFAAASGLALENVPPEWGCNSFEYRAGNAFSSTVCSPSLFLSTSGVAKGQYDNQFSTWVTTKV